MGQGCANRAEHSSAELRATLLHAVRGGTLTSEEELDAILLSSEPDEVPAPFGESRPPPTPHQEGRRKRARAKKHVSEPQPGPDILGGVVEDPIGYACCHGAIGSRWQHPGDDARAAPTLSPHQRQPLCRPLWLA